MSVQQVGASFPGGDMGRTAAGGIVGLILGHPVKGALAGYLSKFLFDSKGLSEGAQRVMDSMPEQFRTGNGSIGDIVQNLGKSVFGEAADGQRLRPDAARSGLAGLYDKIPEPSIGGFKVPKWATLGLGLMVGKSLWNAVSDRIFMPVGGGHIGNPLYFGGGADMPIPGVNMPIHPALMNHHAGHISPGVIPGLPVNSPWSWA